LRTTVPPSFLVCSVLVIHILLAGVPAHAVAQENLVENGDFSHGLEHWIVGGPTNPCEPGNLSEPGGYYGCVMVTDEGTPGNPHLELWTGTGGEYGMERFEQDVGQTLSRLPKDAGSITLSLRVWSLGNTSYVRILIQTGSRENLTLEETYDVQGDWYESYYYPSREPTTITRDITNFHDPTTHLIVAGDRVAVDDIAIVAALSSPEPLLMHQTELIKNGGFSQGLDYWEQDPLTIGRGKISEKGSPGNPHLELLAGPPKVSQEVHLPEDATRISLSIKAWALTLPGQNPENVMPWVEVRITHDGSIFNGTVDQETYGFNKPALRMEPAITITRDLTGFKGKNITLTLMGEEAAVDDVSVLATQSYLNFPATVSGLIPVAAVILATVVGGFLGLRHVRRARNHQNRLRP